MRLVFMGSGAFGVPALQTLVASPHEVTLVVSQPDRPAGRKKALTPSDLAAEAARLQLELFQPERINTHAARERLAAERPDVCVVVAYGQMLRPRVLELPRLCCVNVHGSLLPRHRGASPVQAALLAGDEETGVSIMQMDAGLDSGPVFAEVRTAIEDTETAGELHDRLAVLAAPLLLRVLDDLAAGRATAEPQDASRATTCRVISKEDGRLDWRAPAARIARHVRAMTPWPGAFGEWAAPSGDVRRLILEDVRPLEEEAGNPGEVLRSAGDELVIATGSGALRVLRLRVAGKRSLAAEEFLRGARLEPGTLLLGTEGAAP